MGVVRFVFLECMRLTELAVFKHNTHIRPNRLSGYVPVLTWPEKQGQTVFVDNSW